MVNKSRSEAANANKNENKTPLTVDQINSDRITQVTLFKH